MTRTTMGLCLAAALGFAVSLGAQTTTTTPTRQSGSSSMHDRSGREVTVTGCLARGADGNYMLNNARMDDAMSNRSSTTTTGGATTTSGATTPTGTTGTTATESATAANNPMSWKLEGGHDLDRHLGHKIQVTGRTDWSGTMSSSATTTTASGSSETTTTTGHEHDSMTGPRLDVTSVKMIATSCQ